MKYVNNHPTPIHMAPLRSSSTTSPQRNLNHRFSILAWNHVTWGILLLLGITIYTTAQGLYLLLGHWLWAIGLAFGVGMLAVGLILRLESWMHTQEIVETPPIMRDQDPVQILPPVSFSGQPQKNLPLPSGAYLPPNMNAAAQQTSSQQTTQLNPLLNWQMARLNTHSPLEPTIGTCSIQPGVSEQS